MVSVSAQGPGTQELDVMDKVSVRGECLVSGANIKCDNTRDDIADVLTTLTTLLENTKRQHITSERIFKQLLNLIIREI